MPKLGEPVLYYTHEHSDTNHQTKDYLAFVTSVVDEHTLTLVVFPPMQDLYVVEVTDFDPATFDDDTPPGLSYWRPIGSSPPDFAKLYEARAKKAAEEAKARQALAAKQKAELDMSKEEDLTALRLKHLKEREDLEASSAKNHPSAKPAPGVRLNV